MSRQISGAMVKTFCFNDFGHVENSEWERLYGKSDIGIPKADC